MLSVQNILLSSLRIMNGTASSAKKAAEWSLSQLYSHSNRRPWRLGYGQYRLRYLRSILQDEATMSRFRNSQPLPMDHGYRLDARVVEIPWVASRLQAAKSFLDAGSSFNY